MMQTNAESSMKWKYFSLLAVSLAAYLVAGAFIFRATESSYEASTRMKLQSAYSRFLAANPNLDREELMAFTWEINELASTIGRLPYNHYNTTGVIIWDFSGALTYAITVVTTIGYGHVYPSTGLGRAICILYALLGIPLTLIFLGAVGDKMVIIAMRMGQIKWSDKKHALNKLINTCIIIILGLVLMFLVPALVFRAVEGWSLGTAFYYCFITLSTIGFGDYVAGLHKGMGQSDTPYHVYSAFVYLWILLGLSYLSVVIKYLMRMYLKRADKVKKRVSISMLRGGRQRVILKKKDYESEEVLREALCARCFLKLRELVEKGCDLDKMIPSRWNSLRNLSFRHSYSAPRDKRQNLKRSRTEAQFNELVLQRLKSQTTWRKWGSSPDLQQLVNAHKVQHTANTNGEAGGAPKVLVNGSVQTSVSSHLVRKTPASRNHSFPLSSRPDSDVISITIQEEEAEDGLENRDLWVQGHTNAAFDAEEGSKGGRGVSGDTCPGQTHLRPPPAESPGLSTTLHSATQSPLIDNIHQGATNSTGQLDHQVDPGGGGQGDAEGDAVHDGKSTDAGDGDNENTGAQEETPDAVDWLPDKSSALGRTANDSIRTNSSDKEDSGIVSDMPPGDPGWTRPPAPGPLQPDPGEGGVKEGSGPSPGDVTVNIYQKLKSSDLHTAVDIHSETGLT